MDIAQASLDIGVFLAKIAVIGAFFYLPVVIGTRLLLLLDDRGLLMRPSMQLLTAMSGAVVGLTVLYFNLGFDAFTFDAVFRVGGPWSLTFHDFLLARVNPQEYSFQPVLDRLQPSSERTDLSPLYLAVSGALAVVALRALWLWRSPWGAVRGLLCGALVAAWAGYMALFSLALLLWLANLMNFWLLLPLTYVVHLGRNTQIGNWRASDLAFGSFGSHPDDHHADHLQIDEEDEPEADKKGGHHDHHGGHGGGHGHHGADAGHGAGAHGSGRDDVHPLSRS